MKKELLEEALGQVSDRHIQEAAAPKRKKRLAYAAAIAAVLALVLLVRNMELPVLILANQVSAASESRMPQRPKRGIFGEAPGYDEAFSLWLDAQQAQDDALEAVMPTLEGFVTESCREFLSGSGENLLYSPVNAYLGLAMTAELASGNSRQQLLDALGASSTEVLRQQVSTLWEALYQDDGNELCTLASSLWLDQDLGYSQSAMDDLSYYYYTDIYQRDLSGSRAKKDIANWLSSQTGGFLKNYAPDLPENDPILALYSTIRFQSKWSDEFSAANNTQGTFHGTGGDTDCTFLNAKLRKMNYYWADSYGAVSLPLKNGCRMWLVLPDEGKTVADVLAEGQYWDMVTARYEGWENTKYMKVNLSVPKFDVSAKADLKEGLENMGITDIFHLDTADFSDTIQGNAVITGANQAVRVAIDEKGVTAAAYIEIPGAGAAMPPEEIIDFIVDRPFLFLITGDSGIPLFAGTVNQM